MALKHKRITLQATGAGTFAAAAYITEAENAVSIVFKKGGAQLTSAIYIGSTDPTGADTSKNIAFKDINNTNLYGTTERLFYLGGAGAPVHIGAIITSGADAWMTIDIYY